jgi:hypothetical protein
VDRGQQWSLPTGSLPNRESPDRDAESEWWIATEWCVAMEPSHGDTVSEQWMAMEPPHGDRASY